MKRLILFLLLAKAAGAETLDALTAEAVRANPELRFYEAQLAALPKSAKATPPVLAYPLSFRAADALRDAMLNQDKELAALYVTEFRFALAAEVRLRAIAYQGAMESATTAADLASRIQALVTLLEQRPAAGTQSLIERRILEGAALPFVRAAAEHKLIAEQTRIDLNSLMGRPADASLDVTDAFALPPAEEPTLSGERLLIEQRKAELDRGLAGVDAIEAVEKYSVGSWFTREGSGAFEPLEMVTQSGASTLPQRERLQADAQRKIERELARRLTAYRSARGVAEAIPPDLIKNLGAASELADRQYRVGALSANLLIEVNREWLDALETRNEVILQVWRNRLDLELLQLATPQRTGIITVNPKN